MQRILVAGATGYLGRFVVREFNERGLWVRALVRNPAKLDRTGSFLEPAVNDRINEVFVGEVTKPETLTGVCDDIDIVFSSVGITRQKDKLTYRDVDYQGNKNILDFALSKSVKKFVYVSVFNAHMYEHIAIVKAHEDFVRDLQASGIKYTIIRPTGYFSDMSQFLKMAQSGRAYWIGDGKNKLNPIHGADLAKVCVDAIEDAENEISVGGPVTYSVGEITELAFNTLGKKPKVTKIPLWLAFVVVKLVRPFNKPMSELAEFFIAAGKHDGIAPSTGTRSLDAYYQELVNYL